MREKKIREEALRSYEKEYYKPHFGPEETIERINQKATEEAQKKKLLNDILQVQMVQNKEVSEASKQEDRERDLQFLNAAANTQYIENMALRRKEEALK